MRVRIETDQKSSEMIAKKSILVAPRRLRRMLLQLQRYDLDVMYVPGKLQVVADVLSRAPVGHPMGSKGEKQDVFELEDQEMENTKEREFVWVSDQTMETINGAAQSDPEQCSLKHVIVQGWPSNISQVPPPSRPYWNVRNCITIQDGIIYKGRQVVVSTELIGQILQRLHASHQGIQSTLRRARNSVYWPRDVKRVCSQCSVCEMDSPALPKEKHLAHSIPQKPGKKLEWTCLDLRARTILIVDYLMVYFEISNLKSTVATVVVDYIKEQFT